MDYIKFYKHIYEKFSIITPLYFDCGQLCNNKCCQNNNKGMILFPFEEEFLNSFENDYNIVKSNSYNILYCDGTCNRNFRPLSCIIFPLFPFLFEDGRLDIRLDPRSKNFCPLYYQDIPELEFQPLFRIKLFILFNELIKDDNIKEFLKKLTLELIEIEKFTK